MKKIILAAIGLAMFATPLAAGNPSSGISQHERHLYGMDPHAPDVQAPVRSPDRFSLSPAGSQSFALTAPGNQADPQFSREGANQDLTDRYGRINR